MSTPSAIMTWTYPLSVENPPNSRDTIPIPLPNSAMMLNHTHGKKRAKTRCHTGSRLDGSRDTRLGRRIRWAKNIPPIQITAARTCRTCPMMIMTPILSLPPVRDIDAWAGIRNAWKIDADVNRTVDLRSGPGYRVLNGQQGVLLDQRERAIRDRLVDGEALESAQELPSLRLEPRWRLGHHLDPGADCNSAIGKLSESL